MLRDPGRLAWTVLFISLAIFCLLTTAFLLGVNWFLFDSSVSLITTLDVSRNTVSVRVNPGEGLQAVRSSSIVGRDSYLVTDSSSQGYITFVDPYSREVVASITLHRESSLTVGDATRPRFEFSSQPYIITIQFQGNIDVDIVPELPRRILFDVHSPYGLIRMGNTGRYSLTSQVNRFSVFNRSGQVVIINLTHEARDVAEGMTGRIEPETNAILVEQPLVDLLPDGSFDTFNPADPSLSSEWGCYTLRDDTTAAEGSYRREIINGRSVMHITRVEEPGKPANNHAETGCLQYLNTISDPLPVTQYNYLELRATMQIRDRPLMLSTCGQRGSECPVMIVISYRNQYDQEQQWIHGFYTRYDQAVGWPLRCDTCAQDHEQLNKDTWYTYTSGNLLQLLPQDQRPVAISSVKFYASGHEYEVLLSEVALLAGTMPEAAPAG
ncbi:MAG: hypothetical protein HPY64_06695 [Anaerolineae bacterium]|nr:hypothetical protein [Anaerolineae bacterium]